MAKIKKRINNKFIEYTVRDYQCKNKKCFVPFSGNGTNICRLYELGRCPVPERTDGGIRNEREI
jgi:hypothetical protein